MLKSWRFAVAWHRGICVARTAQTRTRNVQTTAQRWKDLEENPFYDKYKSKLDRVREPMREKIASFREGKGRGKDEGHKTRKPSPLQNHFGYTRQPTLDSVMRMDLIGDKTSEEIGKIWVDYHKTKDCIGAVMTAEHYLELSTKAALAPMISLHGVTPYKEELGGAGGVANALLSVLPSPYCLVQFVYPLPRDEGYEFFFSEFSGNCCYLTSLINYQMYQANAPISLTITHYTDLIESKGIVLMLGEVDADTLSTLEAQFLANQIQLYYGTNQSDRFALVKQFNHDPENFDYNSVLAQLQNTDINRETEKDTHNAD